jgi:hypothetical protein
MSFSVFSAFSAVFTTVFTVFPTTSFTATFFSSLEKKKEIVFCLETM